VYVDSRSTDDSLQVAEKLGVPALQLDADTKVSAARARNLGFAWVREQRPDIEYVQFVDGDCELVAGWVDSGVEFLETEPKAVLVFGRLMERFPASSVYNRLADIEWDTPVGQVRSSGGIFLARVDALAAVEGFRVDMLAGEEPELCVRLQDEGGQLFKIDNAMAHHDSDMYHFSQWWKRSVRDGYAFAEGRSLHGNTRHLHYVKETRSAIVWALVIPAIIVVACLVLGAWGLLLLAVYPLQVARIYRTGNRDRRTNLAWSFFLVLRKFPETLGILKFAYKN
jgi:glycosyltransferase involved in cell wall biosynthesis